MQWKNTVQFFASIHLSQALMMNNFRALLEKCLYILQIKYKNEYVHLWFDRHHIRKNTSENEKYVLKLLIKIQKRKNKIVIALHTMTTQRHILAMPPVESTTLHKAGEKWNIFMTDKNTNTEHSTKVQKICLKNAQPDKNLLYTKHSLR